VSNEDDDLGHRSIGCPLTSIGGVGCSTSTAAREATVRPIIEILGDRTKVLVEQISALDVSRLGERIMTLQGDAMWAIDDALELVLVSTK